MSDFGPVSMPGWMRDITKRLTFQERRPNLQPRVEALEEQMADVRGLPRIRLMRGTGTMTLATGNYTVLGGTDVWTTTGGRAARGGITFTNDRDITVPVAGDYLVELSLSTNAGSGGVIALVKKNNTAASSTGKILWNQSPVVSGAAWVSCVGTVGLAAGDVLTPAAFCLNATTIEGSSIPSYWGVRLIEPD